ncbi:MAG: DUF5050 domain-containing protein, partial [Eggerthellaceae bacterium]|nr:DUF5050 domain-containing protein [Eggerthellaceae bacterium]
AACVVVVALIGAFVLFDPVGKITSLVTAGAPTYSSTGSSDAGAPASSGSSTASGSTGSSSLPLSTEGPLFDTTATGNLTGNLTNGGFAVEGDAETYVALDAGIYALADDGSIGRRVVGAQSPHSLNFYDGKLYYADESLGLMCVDPQSGQAASLCSVFVGGIFIDSGTLYFENAEDSLNLYTVGFDGSGMKLVSGSEAEYYRNVVDGWQYFVNADNGETLCRENLATGEEQQLYDIRSAWVSITGSTLYFSDFSIPGAMVSMSLDGSNTEVLFNDSASYVSATPLGVFFTNSDAQQIEVMSLDGNTRTVLTKSTCGAFCVTRNWIIYENKDDNNSLWAMRTDGSESHRLQ